MKRLLALIVLVPALFVAGPASANDSDVRSTTVPASACTPIDTTQASRVRMSNGAWVFRGSSTGTVTFYCAVDFNAYTKSNNTNDNDVSGFRVFFRDSDAGGNASRVTARLTYRRPDGMYSAGSTWSSNVTNTTANTAGYHQNNHDVSFDGVYSFLVTLRRTSTSQSPAFSGIDFWIPPVG